MATVSKLVPTPAKVGMVFNNKGVISVISAFVVGAPAILMIRRLAQRNPQLAQNISIVMIIVGIIIVGLAVSSLTGMPQAILVGVGAAVLISGIAPFVQRFINIKVPGT